MIRNIRNRLQILKPTRVDFYKFLPLVFIVVLLMITISLGIADPTTPPPGPPNGDGT